MSTTIIVALLSALLGGSGLGGVITYLVYKRKNKAEALGIELDNLSKITQLWQQLSEEQARKIKVLELKIDDLQNDMETIRSNHEEQCSTCKYKIFYEENKK